MHAVKYLVLSIVLNYEIETVIFMTLCHEVGNAERVVVKLCLILVTSCFKMQAYIYRCA